MNPIKIVSLLLFTILLSSCASNSKLKKTSFEINPGMSRSEVINIMGIPSNRQFKTDDNGVFYEALQWDLGSLFGWTSDYRNRDMLVVYFKKNIVTDLDNYVAYYGIIMMVKWEERPDFIFEKRNR